MTLAHPYPMALPASAPAQPRPAATLMLARDGHDGLEIFLLQRTHCARFMPGMFVFPGGALEQADQQPDCVLGDGLDDETASRLLNVERGGLTSFIAAIRETFEEAGILLADDPAGQPVRLDDDARFAGLTDKRVELTSGRLDWMTFCREAELRLAFNRMAYFSHWVTPADLPQRFDTRFFVAPMPAGQTGRHDDDETVAHAWIRPADALARHEEGHFPLAYVTAKTLAALSAFADVASLMAFARGQTQITTHHARPSRGPSGRLVCSPGDAAYAELGKLDPEGRGTALGTIFAGATVVLSPLVRRITAPNPGMMTGPGTNTYLLGRHGEQADEKTGIAIIDPGPLLPDHIDLLIEQAGAPIRWVLATHTHPDHSPGAALIREKTGAILMGMPAPEHGRQDHGFEPQRVLRDGELLEIAGCRLKVLHTPGHASNHLCYLLEDEQLLFTGDQIMQGSTVLINPPDGDMGQYLASLARLKQEAVTWLAPGHGFLMDEPLVRIDRLVAHRLAREQKILAALTEAGPATLADLVPLAYADVAAARHAMAERSLLAHLQKLCSEGLVSEQEGNWRLRRAYTALLHPQ